METYDGPLPAGIVLKDGADAINRKVNEALRSARQQTDGRSPRLETKLFDILGSPSFPKLHLAPIESWAFDLPKASAGTEGLIYEPKAADSQYREESTVTRVGGLAPVMRIDSLIFGVDKIGHFFQLGFSDYYKLTLGKGGLSPADAIKEGDKTEAGMFGLSTTGVFSNADIAANRAGMQFYQDLAKNPAMVFDIRKYISGNWNEQANENLYDGARTQDLQRSNIPGRWSGSFAWTDGSTKETAPLTADFKVTGPETLAEGAKGIRHLKGTYQYRHPNAGHTTGSLDGLVRLIKNADDAVVRTEIEMTWTEGKATGKGTLVLAGLKAMSGTWGRGASSGDGGTWQFFKVT